MPQTKPDSAAMAFGAAIVLALTLGPDLEHRPPAGSRGALELITNNPNRKFVRSALVAADEKIKLVSRTNQRPLTAPHTDI